ncbi:MAG TPA: nitroreductase family deazaflavin-dependent oxidoreductase [Acidimicrobiales bacterium]|nr:nitroreductase family deazaflavin-dependent oxidoreductase [Acidimicrobiales bacterium]
MATARPLGERLAFRVGLGLLHAHQAIYELSDGRVGHRLLGVPCLLLRTTGRRTGKTRTTALVYARDGDDYLVVGSLGGSPTAPAWLHNVRSRPQVGVQIGRERFPAVATVVQRGHDDFERLWRTVNERNAGRYERYQRRTTRSIPVVRLARRSETQRVEPDAAQ